MQDLRIAPPPARPGDAKAFSRTTRPSHAPAEARLGDVTAPALIADTVNNRA